MEMQWKHAVCLHTGEYFHGPFETTDKKEEASDDPVNE